MIIGAGSAYLFAQGCFYYDGMHGLLVNIIAIALLCIADILDCTDGQLARLTGKKSPLGRILDGVAGSYLSTLHWYIASTTTTK